MYREPAGAPPPIDPTLIIPGVGVGHAIVGRTTAEELLAWLGTDCKVSRHSPSGEIFAITYDYENEKDYEPDRPAQLTRPAGFEFEHGLLKSIEIGVYQQRLALREGLRIGSTRNDVFRLFGPATTVLVQEHSHVLRYIDRGIDFGVSLSDDEVSEMVVFRARW